MSTEKKLFLDFFRFFKKTFLFINLQHLRMLAFEKALPISKLKIVLNPVKMEELAGFVWQIS